MAFFIIAYGISGCYISKTKLLDLPNKRKSFEYSCGSGAVQAVLAYYGKNIRESKLIGMSKTDENEGTYLRKIVAFLHLKGLSTSIKQNRTAVELFRYIDKDIPVIVLIEA